jgi:hypothetical protein
MPSTRIYPRVQHQSIVPPRATPPARVNDEPGQHLQRHFAARDAARSRLLNVLLAEALAPATTAERQAAE